MSANIVNVGVVKNGGNTDDSFSQKSEHGMAGMTDTTVMTQAADTLRRLAQNEELKLLCASDPVLKKIARRIADRYIAGESIDEAIASLRAIVLRGHFASLELLGESCRDVGRAQEITEEIVRVVTSLDTANIGSSISLDLSHIGSIIHPKIAEENLRKIALAARNCGREVMISMEDSSRTDTILGIYKTLHQDRDHDFSHVGITLQARLHRTAHDLTDLMAFRGRIRLVKGAYFETCENAIARDSAALPEAYLRFATQLLCEGHLCSIATHDRQIQQQVVSILQKQGCDKSRFEFESLMGLGTDAIDALKDAGMPTREYAVYGDEYFLYVLNRIAEHPQRLSQALIDAADFECTSQ